jgi:NAD+ kinase
MKVALYTQQIQAGDIPWVIEMLDELDQQKAQVYMDRDFFQQVQRETFIRNIPTFTIDQGLDSSFDLFVSFGGDGTMLRAVTYVRQYRIPMVGVNTGRLGFLSTFKKEEVRDLVKGFKAGAYKVGDRSLIALAPGQLGGAFGDLEFALNEITVSRKDTTSMITVETYLDGEFLTSYWADGLIIATPTGSTGYSLSCGGPVIAPSARSFVLTPIAPHNLNARPLVISDETEIRIRVMGREDYHLVSLDSRIVTVPNGQELVIRKADFSLPMLEYQSGSFFNTLRSKLLWGQDQRN